MKVYRWSDICEALGHCLICERELGCGEVGSTLSNPDLFELKKGGIHTDSYFAVCDDCNQIMFNSWLRVDPDGMRKMAECIEALGFTWSKPELLRKVADYIEVFRHDLCFKPDIYNHFYKMAEYLKEEQG